MRAAMRPGLASADSWRQVGPAGGEAVAVGRVDGAGGDEGRDLAQRVAGEGHGRLGQRRPEGLPGHERAEQHRQLAGPGGGQLVGVGVEQEAGQRPAEGRLGLGDHRPRRGDRSTAGRRLAWRRLDQGRSRRTARVVCLQRGESTGTSEGF